MQSGAQPQWGRRKLEEKFWLLLGLGAILSSMDDEPMGAASLRCQVSVQECIGTVPDILISEK